MRAVHTFVAEVTAELIHTLEASDDEALQIKLVGDTQIERDIQRVVMRDERARSSTARDRLQYGRIDLDVATLVEELAHRIEDLRTLEEDILDMAIDNEVNIALAEAELRISEAVEGLTILLLDHGQGTQCLREEGQRGGMYRNLPHLCAEDFALDTDEVADVHELLHYIII